MTKRTNEEIANTITHALGIVFALTATWVLIAKGVDGTWQEAFGMIVFSVAILFMYTASTIYHWTLPGKRKVFFRTLDHINIYVLIASSYTPVLLCAVGGTLGWVGFGCIWAIAVAGSIGKIVALGKYPKLSLAIYLLMGWSAVLFVVPIWNALSETSLWWFLAEGLFYTIGCYFYANSKKHAYYHAIWHVFVLGGTISHFMSMWIMLN